MPNSDPEKRRATNRAAQARWYAKNKPKHREMVAAGRAKAAAWLRAEKALHGCAVCREADPVVLDFHHERDKVISLADAVRWGWSIDRLRTETEKCRVLCANCHRREHAAKHDE